MSKRSLQKYLGELNKKELEDQLTDLYTRFPAVKEYYDFVFNPREDKLLQEAKTKISHEYFPLKRKRPKMRRSVAQKYIKHFLKLGVDPNLIADLMLYNIEIAQSFSTDRNLPDAFFKSMLNSFNEMAHYISINAMLPDFKERIAKSYRITQDRHWLYREEFSRVLDILE